MALWQKEIMSCHTVSLWQCMSYLSIFSSTYAHSFIHPILSASIDPSNHLSALVLFIHLCLYPSAHPSIHPFIHSPIHSSFQYSITLLLSHTFINHSSMQTSIYPFIHHPPIPSPTHPTIYPSILSTILFPPKYICLDLRKQDWNRFGIIGWIQGFVSL